MLLKFRMDESTELLDNNDSDSSERYVDSPKSNSYYVKCFSLLYGIVITILFLGINSYSYVIASENTNHTCYETQYNMSLSKWLYLTTSVAIASNVLMIVYSIFMVIDCTKEDKFFLVVISVPMFMYLIFAAFFSFVMTIMGIIELSRQYDDCIKEAKNVTIMTILIVTINLFYSFISLCGHRKTKN